MIASFICVILFSVVAGEMVYDPARAYGVGFYFGIPALFINLATDCTITGLTLYKLVKSHRGLSQTTDTVIKRLVVITLEAAVPPALVALAEIMSFAMAKTSAGGAQILFAFFNVMIPRLYICSLMYILNARSSIRQAFENETVSHCNANQEHPMHTKIAFAIIQSGKSQISIFDAGFEPARIHLVTDSTTVKSEDFESSFPRSENRSQGLASVPV